MRLIDADRLNPDRMTNKGTVAISQSQIANAPTVDAVPMSVIEDIKADLSEYSDAFVVAGRSNIASAVENCIRIIDKHIGAEMTDDET